MATSVNQIKVVNLGSILSLYNRVLVMHQLIKSNEIESINKYLYANGLHYEFLMDTIKFNKDEDMIIKK